LQHAEKRYNVWYAKLTVPADVRHAIGKVRYFQSTNTSNANEALPRVALLVSKWKDEIEKARGTLPDPKATFWGSLRHDYINAKDDAHQFAIEEQIEKVVSAIKDPAKALYAWKHATGQMTPLAPLVEQWKGSLRLAQKTIDQQHRDVKRMADYFIGLEELTPQRIKDWTDKLIAEGTTASSFERIGNGCRSFWSYLQQSGVKAMLDQDPFVGPFKLAQRTAVSNKVERAGFTAPELSNIYAEALKQKDQPLADLIALGAYTGARIEELCTLTKETAKGSIFRMGTKTEASVRECPVHPAIKPLVARLMKHSTDGYLIPSAAKNQYGNRSGPLSQRFGHLKKALGFGPAYVFHSLRHTVVSLMHQGGVRPEVIADVVGHEKGNFTLDTYGSGSSVKQKLDALSKVTYRGALAKP
jgi:integrase